MDTTAESTIQVDNDRTRVTHWRLAPGAATGFHRHEFDYVVVPLTTGGLRVIDKDGNASFGEMVAGASCFRSAGVDHIVLNANADDFVFVDVEYK